MYLYCFPKFPPKVYFLSMGLVAPYKAPAAFAELLILNNIIIRISIVNNVTL